MKSCQLLKKNESAFKNLTGIAVAEFDQLYHELVLPPTRPLNAHAP